MGAKSTFKRIEKKFIITEKQFLIIKEELDKRFIPDEYGETTICNLYYDTPNYQLVRRSIEKPVYKEKLRLRTYGVPNNNSTSFIELKKKYNSVVFKRRIVMPLEQSMSFLQNDTDIENPDQITKEIKYFLNFYKGIAPMFYISYARSAFFEKEDKNFRITFDRQITWRDYDLDLTKGVYGNLIIPKEYVVMEIKIPDSIPLWLAKLLSELKIASTSFSKVGRAYAAMITKQRGK